MNNTIMITGINGQDGCYLAKIALENGYDVIGVQRKSTNNTAKDVIRPFKELGIYKNINFHSNPSILSTLLPKAVLKKVLNLKI